MTLQEITALIDRLEKSCLQTLIWQEGESRLELKKADQGSLVAPVASATSHASASASLPSQTAEQELEIGECIKAPLVGTCYLRPAPNEKPYVQVNQRIKKGQTLCLIEAMKMMNEITAPQNGILREILVEDGALVGFDTPLFRWEAE